MKKIILTFLVLGFPVVALGYWKTGNTIKAECGSSSLVEKSLCLGYITGVSDVFKDTSICYPKGVTAGQIESIVIKYLNEHPDRLHYSADSLVLDALGKAFPCKVKK
jgi:hypothetical protein